MLTIEQLYSIYSDYPNIQTDTRKIREGDIFLALKGPHFNGNAFAEQALEKGAAYAIIDEKDYLKNHRMLLVANALDTLQQLSARHREQLSIPVLAITGSNGKTTTKELTQAVLQTTYRTYATEGNLNNHIGVPLTLLRIRKDTEIAIIEMGANHQKEIESYCRIAKPTHGLITNIGKAHLEGFGGVEGVKKGKGELFDFLRKSMGVAFSCADFSYFMEMTKGLDEIHWYGTDSHLPLFGRILQKSPYLKVELNYGGEITSQLAGSYNLYNILAAAAVGKYFKVKEDDIRRAISNYSPNNSRSQLIKKESNTYILDAYNANPTSMQAAISDFAERPETKKYLLLGAMMELGADSIKEHQYLIDFITKFSWKEVILVGGDFGKIRHPYHYFSTIEEAHRWFQNQSYRDSVFLIKGSRTIGMEKILD